VNKTPPPLRLGFWSAEARFRFVRKQYEETSNTRCGNNIREFPVPGFKFLASQNDRQPETQLRFQLLAFSL